MGANLGDASSFRGALEISSTLEAFKEILADNKLERLQEDTTMRLLNMYASSRIGLKTEPEKKTKKDLRKGIKKVLEGGEMKEKVDKVRFLKDTAQKFQQFYKDSFPDEITAEKLITLSDDIEKLFHEFPEGTPIDKIAEAIISHVTEKFKDPTAADIAMKFLKETLGTEIANAVSVAKKTHYQDNKRVIDAGYNSAEEAHKLIEELKSVAAGPNREQITSGYLRDLYREISDKQPDSMTLFSDFSSKYNYGEMLKISKYLFHAAGQDLTSDGPSIEPGKLSMLIKQIKNLQATLGVYGFFKAREALVQKLFQGEELNYPPQLGFESLAKAFISILKDRYPQGSKIVQTVNNLGADRQRNELGKVKAQVILIELFRDAIPNLDNKRIEALFKRKEEFLEVIYNLLEDLYIQIDELEEMNEFDNLDDFGTQSGSKDENAA